MNESQPFHKSLFNNLTFGCGKCFQCILLRIYINAQPDFWSVAKHRTQYKWMFLNSPQTRNSYASGIPLGVRSTVHFDLACGSFAHSPRGNPLHLQWLPFLENPPSKDLECEFGQNEIPFEAITTLPEHRSPPPSPPSHPTRPYRLVAM